MKKFTNKNKYYLVLYDDEELTKPEISTLIYLDKFSDRKNNIIFKFESVEDNDPKKSIIFMMIRLSLCIHLRNWLRN